MPCKQIRCEGMDEFQKIVGLEEKQAHQTFVLFTGKVDATGNSWCPDCVDADPVIESAKPSTNPEDTFIECIVGDRPTWKDPKCPFRTNPKTKLKGIPTLVKWGTPERLNSDDCKNADLVTMLFTD